MDNRRLNSDEWSQIGLSEEQVERIQQRINNAIPEIEKTVPKTRFEDLLRYLKTSGYVVAGILAAVVFSVSVLHFRPSPNETQGSGTVHAKVAVTVYNYEIYIGILLVLFVWWLFRYAMKRGWIRFTLLKKYPIKSSVVALAGIVAAYTLFVSVPYSVNKDYQGAVYNQHAELKQEAVIIKGQVYRGLFQGDKFIGTVKVGASTYSIETTRTPSPMSAIWHPVQLVPTYPYVALVGATDAQNMTTTIAIIEMSGNFNSIVVESNAIREKYGKEAEFSASTH